jgi:molecular chaperone GrpE
MRKLYEPKGDEPRPGNDAGRSTAEHAGDAESAAESTETGVGQEPSLADELAAAKQQAADNYERYIRAVAEMQNVLRRQERERAELGKYAIEALARDLLPTLDDLERALEHSSTAPGGDGGFVAGVEMVRKGLLAALERHGVVRISALGQPFDPSRHEAVGMTEAGDATPNTVVAEHRAGYMIGERLLRPAIVIVAMAGATASES